MDKFKGFKFDRKIYVAAAVVLVIIICIAAYFISGINKNDEQDKKANVSLVGTNLKQDVTVEQPTYDANRVAATVDIEFSDCAVAVGTQFKVVASVSPADAAETLKWTSSNEAVFVVDKTGVVTVNGVGTAVLTANIGDVSDAVVIEGIRNIAAGSSNNFPVYTDGVLVGNAGDSGGTGNAGDTGNSGNTGGSGNSGDTSGGSSGGTGSAGNAGDTGNSGNTGGSGSLGDTSGGNAGGTGNSGNTGSSGGLGDTSGGNAGDTGNSGNTGGSGNSGDTSGGSSGNAGGSGNSANDADSEGIRSDSIGSYLPGLGFNKYMSNIYIYEEAGENCGQIVVLPNVTIVYIMNRSDSFDKKINEVLSLMLTDNSELVWNNYTTANTDRTFTVGDRTVRIVVAGSGGHSQIVIYN